MQSIPISQSAFPRSRQSSLRDARLARVGSLLVVGSLLFSQRTPAQDLPVYADQLLSSFESWSWAAVELANAVPTHSGAASIKVTAGPWEAFRVNRATPLAPAGYASLTFWIHGGAAGGQPLVLQAVAGGNPLPGVDLSPVPANTWKQYTVSLAALGLAGQPAFDGFWIQNNSGNNASPFFIDDILLLGAGPPPPAGSLKLEAVQSDNGLPARRVQWVDAAGQPRSAVMVDQRPQGAGYLRRLTYRLNGQDRVCTGTGDNGHNGDGYVQNHSVFFNPATGNYQAGDDSSHFTPGTTTVVLAGAHHAILQYDMPNYRINQAQSHVVPTMVQWFFANGRAHPIFALSQDARATPGGLGADSRSPYGDVAYDGGAGAFVGGASFGDTYKFTTLAANPERVTQASGWRYDEQNTIPYAMQWADPGQVDAEMGHVATVPLSVQDQGSDPRTYPVAEIRNQQRLNGPMIHDENWAYQILNYVWNGNNPITSKRLTWGNNFGILGGFDNYTSGQGGLNSRQYSQHRSNPLGQAFGGARADGMLLAYSVFVVLGSHSGGYKGGTVGQVVKQMENSAAATLTTLAGTVRTSGPKGAGPAANATVNYQPPGYNPIYATWELNAAGNAVDATLTPAVGTTLDHPILVVNGYTAAQLPASISVGNGLATPEVDYFVTLDVAGQRLWITVNRVANGPVNLKVVPPGGGTPAPVITAVPASGVVGTKVVIAGNNFLGATAVKFNGLAATFTVDSATQISAVVPAGATVGLISVTTPGGTALSAGNFTPLPSPQPPSIVSFPASAAVGAAITILGAHFVAPVQVTFNGAESLQVVIVSSSELTAIVPANATVGAIRISTPNGSVTSATSFTPLAVEAGVIPGVFQQMDTDCGGWFTGIAVHPSGRLYGRTDVGGLYRSDDHGDHWNYLSGNLTAPASPFVQGVAIAAADANIVYQCVGVSYNSSGAGIWKSVDGGVNWQQVKAGINFSGNDAERWGGECIAIRAGNDNEVWAGSRANGLWRSTDAGANWTQIGTTTFADAQFTSICLPPGGRPDIWVSASGFSGPGGIWVSTDQGASWTAVSSLGGGVNPPTSCWRIVRQSNGKVLATGRNAVSGSTLYEFSASNWGNPATFTWSDISWPGMDRSQEAPLVAALADGRVIAGTIFGGYNGGPAGLRTQIRSVAGTWTPVDSLSGPMPAWQRSPAPTLVEGGRNALVQDPTDPNRWFMAGGYGPFRTLNAGVSWHYIVNGVDEVVAYKVNFHPSDPNRVYLPMADHGGAMVLDGGASGAVSRYITTRALPYPDDLGFCRVILASGDRLLGLGADERANWRPRIFRSTDNGLTWTVAAHAGLPAQDNRCIVSAVAARDNPNEMLVAVAGTDDGANGGVYRSTDGGSTFSRTSGLPTGGNAQYGNQFDPWADLETDATTANTRYLFLKNHGLFRSTNRGASWAFVNTGLPNFSLMAADTVIGGRLWVGSCCNHANALSRSVDGGNTWSPVPGFTTVLDVDAVNDRVAVLGQRAGDAYSKIYYSGDSGATWGEITRAGYQFVSASAVAVDPWRPGTVWISSNGRSVARFTPGIAVAPRLAINLEAASAGLKIVSGPGLYDRQNIVTDTAAQDYGWVGAAGGPVSYRLTIADFPAQAHRGFQAHIFLVPDSTGSISPDWVEPSLVMLDIQALADGSATAWVRHKVNRPNDNSYLYGAGTLGQVTCATGPKGTWSLSFTANASVTLTAPDGKSASFNLPDAPTVQTVFGKKLTAYFGNQPNEASQVGQPTVFSRVQILNTPRGSAIDEVFPGPELNQHSGAVAWKWLKLGNAPSGYSIPMTGSGLALSWTLPDDGFALQYNPSLNPNTWTNLGLLNVVAEPDRKVVRFSREILPGGTNGFFRMIRR